MLAALYLGALSLLILWEYHERLEGLSSGCTLHDEAKSSMYSRPYSWLLNWATPGSAGHVVSVAIPADLEDIQSNVCLGRAYLADVVRALQQRAGVIAIDKFFSPNACLSDPAPTRALMDAVKGAGVPVVIGESTNGIEEPVGGSCLVRKPQLAFDAPNVMHGLTRLNAETERFPMRWLVLPSGTASHNEDARVPHDAGVPNAEFADSLSLAVVKAYDPEFASRAGIQRLIREDDHAYANLNIDLPRTTSTALLCATGDVAVRQRWGLKCPARTELLNMQGKVVLIGAENSTDVKTALDRHMWGFELQAQYIESLLSGDYLRSLPVAFSFGLFVVFVVVIEGLPIALQAYRPRWKHKTLLCFAYQQRRYVWVVFWTIAIIVMSAVVTLALRRLPPLELYGDILFVAITRLMYFSAESAEHPLLHAHRHHRKEIAMNKKNIAPPDDSGPIPNDDAEIAESAKPLKKPMMMRAVAAANSNNPGSEGGTQG